MCEAQLKSAFKAAFEKRESFALKLKHKKEKQRAERENTT
jgi:hypothetical protein